MGVQIQYIEIEHLYPRLQFALVVASGPSMELEFSKHQFTIKSVIDKMYTYKAEIEL